MVLFDVKYLIGVFIGVDIIFFILIVLLIRRIRSLNKKFTLEKEIKTFESMVKDADNMAGHFNTQLKEKYRFIKKLNDKLDKRINNLNLLVNRSEIVLSRYGALSDTVNHENKKVSSRQTKILKLARHGHTVEEISRELSIPRGEVSLVLNMN